MDFNHDGGMDGIDNNLLNQFSSMGTTDKDVLISQFQNLLGFQLNPAGCAFFLDMTNWNLQSAIGAYYDFEGGPQMKLPSMSFLRDVTIGEGEAIPPNTRFVKTWEIQNSGMEHWPSGCCLRFINGEKMGAADHVSVPSLSPKDSTEVAMNMVSPSTPGIYQGQWRIYTPSGTPFGDIIWVIISVKHDGVMDITQQISRVACDLGERSQANAKDLHSANEFMSQTMFQQSNDDVEMGEDVNSNKFDGAHSLTGPKTNYENVFL